MDSKTDAELVGLARAGDRDACCMPHRNKETIGEFPARGLQRGPDRHHFVELPLRHNVRKRARFQ